MRNTKFAQFGLREMVKDIEETAALLESDYINPNDTSVQRHISVVIDFYHRFAKRITAMMENNKDTNVISIMGP
ncbi:MAG: hypothetical protein NC094_05220 [Bacteroidales bacterium]|nr:hypothetical protein [Lachnoclostridium sp.]MCM1384136.1 hypothetical protein [Lachnoclostridium sp.]MCM1464802.1 hypothetical protein [Bacteroidales bacterium]